MRWYNRIKAISNVKAPSLSIAWQHNGRLKIIVENYISSLIEFQRQNFIDIDEV